ncbi:MAG: hypothetical protein AAB697_00890 [Patescibacteria group bacterium]
MINLLPDTKNIITNWMRYKGVVGVISSFVLGGYILVAAGSAGWWLFLTRQDESVKKEIASLTQQISDLKATETAVRAVDERVGVVNSFLTGRADPAKIMAGFLAQVIDGVKISGWSWKSDKNVTVATIEAADLQVIETFRQKIKGSKIINLTRSKEGLWVAEMQL